MERKASTHQNSTLGVTDVTASLHKTCSSIQYNGAASSKCFWGKPFDF